MRVHYEKKSAKVRVDHEKKSNVVRVDHEKKSDGQEFTMRKRVMG